MLAQIADSIIIEIIKKSVVSLYNKDHYLLQNQVREECVNHRLSIHLESSLNDCPSTAQLFAHNLVVDCEYDKHLGCDKTGVGIKDMRPDITVHERGTDSNNFLFIEIKKDKKYKQDIDKCKLAMSSKYNYSFSAHIFHLNNTNPQMLLWSSQSPCGSDPQMISLLT